MKKVISDVVNFPNGCETVRFTACFVSMLMRAEGITDKGCDFFCGKQKEIALNAVNARIYSQLIRSTRSFIICILL